MLNLPLYIAKRLGSSARRPALRIATAGVAVGLAVMLLTVSVVGGFKHTIRDKVAGFGSHIRVSNFLTLQTTDPIAICLDDSLMGAMRELEGVKSVQRYALTQGLLKTEDDFLGITFKGIGPEYDLSFLDNCIVPDPRRDGLPRLRLRPSAPARWSDTTSTGNIMISAHTARKLHLEPQDAIYAYFISKQGQVRARKFKVAAIFETNMSIFDENLCIIDLYTAQRLNGWTARECSGAEVLVEDFSRLDNTAAEFYSTINRTLDTDNNLLSTETIYEAYPSVFGWLDLLDINVWVILALMACLAGVTMISGLLIIILERTQMIGLMKALGAPDGMLRRTFLWMATFIIGRGLLIGDAVALLIIIVQNLTGLLKLDAQTYYVSQVPMELNIPILLLINAATLLTCLLALLAPSHIVARISPAKSMRYE